MKKLNLLLLIIIVLTSCNSNSQNKTGKNSSSNNKLKRYDVKSGIVHYKTTTSGKVMGGTVKGSGTESLYFKDWGAIELKETKSKQTTNVNVFGMKQTQTDETHTMDKLDNGKSYSVDFKDKVIYEGDDMAMTMMKQSGTDAGKAGKDMLKSMGGKKTGNEKVLGYNCEVWTVPGGKEWLYKGVVLKIDMNVMGVRTIQEATDAKFNISVPDSKFKLPDFPVKKMNEMMNGRQMNGDMDNDVPDDVMKQREEEYMKQMQNMSFEDWKKMVQEEDPDVKNMSDKELRQQYDMMKQMMKLYNNK